MSYVLAIDQGTTSSRAFIYNSKLEIVGKGQRAFPLYYPNPGWVEQDAEEIWTSVAESIEEAIASVEEASFNLAKISSIGITNQRETFLLWDRKNGKPLAKATVWQCNRSEKICSTLEKTEAGKRLAKLTGLKISPYFSGTKLKHFFQNNKAALKKAKNSEIAFGTIDTFLLWRLTNGASHSTDVSNASRTLMMDLKKLEWSDEALKTLNVPKSVLPKICDSDALFGRTKGLAFLPDGIAIHGILGDQQSALFGQSCFKKGSAKITYGTGAFMLINTGDKILRSKTGVSTVAWRAAGKTQYALESSVFIAGAAVQFLRDNLELIKESSEIEELANKVKSSEGVFFIPALTGLGSPYWRPEARGLIGGLTRATKKEHIARACLSGIVHSVADVFAQLVKDSKGPLHFIKVDGGASKNDIMMQEQADLLRVKVTRPVDVETTVRGAAAIAALGAGLCSFKDLESQNAVDKNWKALVSKAETTKRLALWTRRVKALLAGAY